MKILIATDGSDFSRQAIEKACEILAEGENNLIEIISVSEEVAHPVGEPFAVSTEYITLLSGIEIALTSNRLNISSKNTFSENF